MKTLGKHRQTNICANFVADDDFNKDFADLLSAFDNHGLNVK